MKVGVVYLCLLMCLKKSWLGHQIWFISNVMYRVILIQQNSFSLVLVLVLGMDIILTIICSSIVSTIYNSFSYYQLLVSTVYSGFSYVDLVLVAISHLQQFQLYIAIMQFYCLQVFQFQYFISLVLYQFSSVILKLLLSLVLKQKLNYVLKTKLCKLYVLSFGLSYPSLQCS